MKVWLFTTIAPITLVFSLLGLFIVAIVSDDQAEAAGRRGMVCTTEGDGATGTVAGMAGEQLKNASEIVAAGKEMGLPQRAWVIAVATAMQESTLRNIGYGDAAGPDSRGLFQQRDSWGPLAVRMNPRESAKLFYRALIKVPNWESLPLTVAAQKVQRSAFPSAYAKWEQKAMEVVGAVEGIRCTSSGAAGLPPGITLPDNPKAATVVKAALSQVGVDYAWGGGNANGPTKGIRDGGVADSFGDYNKIGFDCSGLALYAYSQIGVMLPHNTQLMWNQFQPAITDRAKLQPGDLLMLGGRERSTSNVHHVGIYLGGGKVVEAQKSGTKVMVRDNIWDPSSNYAGEFVGALRPGVV
ncbi:C40 family peptidase [Longimycelium tulufanense]|uniref:C40 family peptidase n=1 Tax=Longimycelium tulufanense TaxID=907463 RepID=UPI0016682575|nr:C40 family peptidase [Longimycelium tulufanense]